MTWLPLNEMRKQVFIGFSFLLCNIKIFETYQYVSSGIFMFNLFIRCFISLNHSHTLCWPISVTEYVSLWSECKMKEMCCTWHVLLIVDSAYTYVCMVYVKIQVLALEHLMFQLSFLKKRVILVPLILFWLLSFKQCIRLLAFSDPDLCVARLKAVHVLPCREAVWLCPA